MLQDMLADVRFDSDFAAQPADIFMRRATEGEPCQVGSIRLTGQSLSFGRNAEIYGEGTPAAYLYKMVSGAVRTYRVLADGRRQIQAFYAPGTFSASSSSPSTPIRPKRSSICASC